MGVVLGHYLAGELNLDLTSFIDAYRGPLIGLIVSWGAPWADAAEIAQDSFSESWLNREACQGDFNDPEFLGRWLRGVALNKYRNWFRSQRRRRVRVAIWSPEVLQQIAVTPDRVTAEYRDALLKAIDRLPSAQREVIYMHYLEETRVKEVAILLAVSAKTVEGRLYQARHNLRRLLGEDFPADPTVRIPLCL